MPDRDDPGLRAKKTVLVLEDRPSVSELLRVELEARGCFVVVAETVAAAKAAYEGAGWDVLVADYDVPDGNGCDFLDWCADRAVAAPGLTVLFTGLSRDREVAAMRFPPGEVVMKDRLPELVDLVAAR